MKQGFNIMDQEALNESDTLKNDLSVIRFLRKIRTREKLPSDICLRGFDTLIGASKNPDSICDLIRSLLIDRSDYLINNNLVIQVLLDGKLVSMRDTYKPISKIHDKNIEISKVFGRLKPVGKYAYYRQLNLSS